MAQIDLPTEPTTWTDAPPSKTRRPAADSPEPSLPLYMREMGQVPLLTREQEVRLATEVQESRARLATVVRRLPADSRQHLFGAAGGPPEDPAKWDVAEIDRCVRRLARVKVSATARREIRRLHHRLERSRSKLTVANLRLVIHIARRYTRNGLPLMDLIQEGNLGLMRAVEKFDVGLGHRFSTYSYWWIKQSIERAIADKSRTIRVPVHLGEKRKRIMRAARALSEKLTRKPNPTEIARQVDMPVEQVEEILSAVPELRSLDEPRPGQKGGDPFQVADTAPSSSAFHNVALRERTQMIERALDQRLSVRERAIIRLRYGLADSQSHTLDEIGKIVGLSRERVRQLEQQAIQKLKRSDALSELLASMGAA